jgi:hypothetical protein
VIFGNHGRSPLRLYTLASTGDFEATVIDQVITTSGGNGALINEWQNIACRKEATRFKIYRNGVVIKTYTVPGTVWPQSMAKVGYMMS